MDQVVAQVQNHEVRITALEKSMGDLVKNTAELKQIIESESKFTRELLKDTLGHKQRMEEKKLESRTSIILKFIGAATAIIGGTGGLMALIKFLLERGA